MRSVFLLLSCCICLDVLGQNEGKWMRAFPITDYMVDLDDSNRVVQLEMPDGWKLPDKQLAIAYGVYKTSSADVVQKGYGRCQLVKEAYHYFSIGHNQSGIPLQAGDLLYMFLDSSDIYYGRIPQLAAHFIRLQDIYEKPFYDRYLVFNKWTIDDEQVLLDSMVADIRFTGEWMKENNNDRDVRIESGKFKDKTVFQVMEACTEKDLLEFLDFMVSHPRNYAGGTWKVTEVFATWATRAS